MQPSSVPVDRQARRAKSDGIDAELLLRTLLAWLRGEPRVCSMVPVAAEADEDARRCIRERTELVAEQVALVNCFGAVLATLGMGEYNPLLRNRRERLDVLLTVLGTSLPSHAHAKISRTLDRLDLVRARIAALEQKRDAVLENEVPDRTGEMIQQLNTLRGIGVQSMTVLVREAFVREFANGLQAASRPVPPGDRFAMALGSYAGLCATPYSGGGTEREQGTGKAGNRRLRTVMVELAWLWQRYQPGSAPVGWFRERVGGTGARLRKVMVIALRRKLLIGLWRFATQGVVPKGTVMKLAS